MRCQIYILMKQVIILSICENMWQEKQNWKIQVFHSTILQPFQFEPELKKTCGNESQEKETKHIYTSAANLLHIWFVKLTLNFFINWASNVA